MSVFNLFAVELDDCVKEYMTRYDANNKKVKDIDAAISERENELRKLRTERNQQDADIVQGEIARLQLDRKDAKAELDAIVKDNKSVSDCLKDIQTRLEKAIDEKFCADPSQVDQNTITLINAGLLRVSEYERLALKAEKEGNITMVRIIGSAASESSNNESDPIKKTRLRNLANYAARYDGRGYLDIFTSLVQTAKLACGDPSSINREHRSPNPLFYKHWEELVGEKIRNF